MTLTVNDLENLFAAFNRHDIDGAIHFFAGDYVFNAIGGLEVYGTQFVGTEAIAQAFTDVWKSILNAVWDHYSRIVQGDRDISEWVFTGTAVDGARVEAEGCDLFTFRDGKIVRKQAFRKDRPLLRS